MTYSQLAEAPFSDVIRLAKWLSVPYERKENELPQDYRKRMIVAVALRVQRKMLVEP